MLEGQDTHALNQAALKLPSRLIAKIFLFRVIFRGSGYSFANDPDFTHVSADASFWDEKNEAFYTKYAGIDKCHKQWKEDIENYGKIVSPLGREWEVPLFNSYGKLNWTQWTNFPVQGTGADVMMLARISFANRLKKLGWPVLLIQTVHDSIAVDCPSEYSQQVARLFHEVFKDLQANIKKIFGYTWVVPLECEVKAGPNQKDMKELKIA